MNEEKRITLCDEFKIIDGRLAIWFEYDAKFFPQQCIRDWSKPCTAACPYFGKTEEIKHYDQFLKQVVVEKRLELCESILIRDDGHRKTMEELEANMRIKKQKRDEYGSVVSRLETEYNQEKAEYEFYLNEGKKEPTNEPNRCQKKAY